MRFTFRLLFLLALLPILAAACAKEPSLPEMESVDADAVWSAFLDGNNDRPDMQGDFLLGASLNYSGPNRSHRVVIRFWGHPDLPLRMELAVNMGTIITSWREDTSGFMAYFPDDEAVYLHPDPLYALEALGFSFPLSLRGFGRLLTGNMRGLLNSEYENVTRIEAADMPDQDIGPGYEFTVKEEDGRYRILLDMRGRLVRFITPEVIPWVLTVSSYMEDEGFPRVPAKVRMARSNTETAILRTKKLEFRTEAWPEDSLVLDLPEETEYRRIRDPQ